MKRYLTTLLFLCSFFTIASAQLEITEHPPSFLFNLTDIFSEGEVEILNIEFFGAAPAVGYFENGMDAIGIEEGFVLTTGRAKIFPAFNTIYGADGVGVDFATTNNSIILNDSDMEAIANTPLDKIYDPSILSMDFIAISNQLTIEYVFGSEEYPEFVGSQFNDVFGIFVSGPGINGPYLNNADNIALIPGSNDPVSINTINLITPLFVNFYHENETSNIQPVYDGYLDVFEATFDVIPYEVYTLKLAVTDIGDGIFDSAIFLKTSSSNPNNAQIATNLNDPEEVFYEGTDTLALNFDFSDFGNEHFPFTHHISGSATQGDDYKLIGLPAAINLASPAVELEFIPIKDTEIEGAEYMRLDFISSTGAICSYYLNILEETSIILPEDTLACSFENFNLEVILPIIINDYEFTDSTVEYINILNKTHTPSVNVQGVPFETIFDPALIKSVCVNIEHSAVDNLNLFLVSPDGKSLELATKVGKNCDDLVNTSFSPLATDSISTILPIGGCSPGDNANSTGVFIPEGNWDDLLGAAVNGKWQLLIWDDEVGGTGDFLNWSLTFSDSALYKFDYSWSTGDSTNTINVSPLVTTTYYVTVSDEFYSEVDSVTLEVIGVSTEDIFVQTCANECYTAPDGSLLCDPGDFEFTIFSYNGCDSIVTIHLSHLPTPQSTINKTTCPGECITLPDGTTVCDPGIYAVTLTSQEGCDSLVTIEYNHILIPVSEESQTVCEGECIVAPDGSQVCDPGDYEYVLNSWQGCDSLVTIHLNQIPKAYEIIDAEICQGACLTAPDGTQLCDGGSYNYQLTATNGCDSLLTIKLSLTVPDTTYVNISTCEGECYEQGGQLLCDPGVYNFQYSSPQGCDSVVIVEFEHLPQFFINSLDMLCDNDCISYTLMFELSGGDPSSYEVFPPTGTLNGNVFTSDEILNGEGFQFSIVDGNSCDTIFLSEPEMICECLTYAGTIDQSSIEICGESTVTANHNEDEILGTDEVLCFIFHNGDNIPITVSNTPSFSFLPGEMSLNTVYYISAVAGNNNGSGCPDFADPTLNISPGTPVIFHEIPTAALGGNETICEGEETSFEINLTGNLPWSLIINDGLQSIELNGIINNPFLFNIEPSGTTTYSVLEVSDKNCQGLASGNATVNVPPAPSAMINGDATICLGEEAIVQLNLEGTAPWTIIVFDGSQAQTLAIQASPLDIIVAPIITTTFTISAVTDGNGCQTGGSGSATIEVIQPAIATANSNIPLCVNDDLQLLASDGVSHQWVGPNNFSSDEQNPIIKNLQLGNAGTFTVFITDQCQLTDTAFIEVDFACMFLNETVQVGLFDTLCFSSIINSFNLCEENDTIVGLAINQQTNCLIIEGLSIGTDTICLEIVENGDTINLDIAVNVEEPLGINNSFLNALINIYPNPATQHLFIEYLEVQIESIEIFDQMGKKIVPVWANENPTKIQISDLAAGIYIFRINTSLGMVSKRVVVIQ